MEKKFPIIFWPVLKTPKKGRPSYSGHFCKKCFLAPPYFPKKISFLLDVIHIFCRPIFFLTNKLLLKWFQILQIMFSLSYVSLSHEEFGSVRVTPAGQNEIKNASEWKYINRKCDRFYISSKNFGRRPPFRPMETGHRNGRSAWNYLT